MTCPSYREWVLRFWGLMKLFYQLMLIVGLAGLLVACDRSEKPLDVIHQQPAFVTQKGNKYTIAQDDTQLTVVADIGGRISSLKVAGQEMLFTADLTHTMVWGGTFWSSPQSDWFWPPVAALDSGPYKVSLDNDHIIFTSAVDETTGYQFVKNYGVNQNKKCLSVKYSIYNRSNVEKNVAAWEVTRVPPKGTVFFPQGDTEASFGIFYPIVVESIREISWFTYDASKILDNHHKINTDGKEGWLAYANNGYLLVKEFNDVPVELVAAGEGEIELYVNDQKTYMELNQQSALVTLAPGEHLDWEVLWHTRKLPADMKVVNGNEELVRYVHSVLNGSN